MSVQFTDFGIGCYPLFLKVKSLPEYEIEYLPESETYRIHAPARFAAMLGVEPVRSQSNDLPLADCLLDDQRAITALALAAKRYACWAGCGNGKTLIGLEFARHVVHRTGGRFLFFTLNDLVEQWFDENRKFYGDTLPMLRLESREEMREWAAGRLAGPQIAITNYEKMNYRGRENQVVNELRYLAGVAVDENRLKGGGGKQKWAIVKSCRGVEYKLSLTATPAPNDTIEFASQGSFLEKLRHQDEIIWTYFTRNEKTHRWEIKRHARKAFFEWMSGWSIYVRDPRRYGWRKDFPDVPAPVTIRHSIDMLPQQRAWMQRLSKAKGGQLSLIDHDDRNTIQRGKLSQIAKGFRYLKRDGKRVVELIPSKKPAFVAELIRDEVAAGLQTLVWTEFDAESDLIVEQLDRLGVPYEMLHGNKKRDQRAETLARFRSGQSCVLVTKAKLLGFGQNLQCVGSMIFSGFSDSYEAFYQAIRRAFRFGQTKAVRVHLPVIDELEGDMLENLLIKEANHEAAIEEMEANYIVAQKLIGVVA
jgi:superfamily II DNA or RNA helicase